MNPLLIDVPTEIAGERVLLRAYRPGDGQALFEAIDESREHLLPWLPFGPQHQSPTDSELYIRGSMARWAKRDDLAYAITDLASGRILGAASLIRIDWQFGNFEIGYWVRASAAGRGYITETVALLTQMAFAELNANRISITVAAGNTRSAAIPERLGFTYEGAIRQSLRTEDGLMRDRLLYGLLREEWDLEQKSPRAVQRPSGGQAES